MVKKFFFLFIALLLSFTLLQAKSSVEDPFAVNLDEIYLIGTKADYLAGQHLSLELECVDCHGRADLLTDNEVVLNEKCISCHGNLDEVSAKTKHLLKNPHKSHLGDINCTVCHSGHMESTVYCNNCHSFNIEMNFKGQKQHYFPDDFSLYLNSKPNRVEKADVVVIGAGGAGMIAAINAVNANAKVILLEKMPIPGGNSQLAAGGMNAAPTEHQAKRGIIDTAETMYEDTFKGGQYKANPKLVKLLANESNASIHWLKTNGINLNYVGLAGGATNPRMHAPAGGHAVGSYLVNNLKKIIIERGIDLRLNSKAIRLVISSDGSVKGVVVKGKHSGIYEIQAKSVVLTSGGFSANSKLVEQLRPSFTGMTTSNQPGALGDGLFLAERIGANLIDMSEIQIHPSVVVGSQILITEVVRGAGAILVNHDGNRFYDELSTRDKVSAAILAQKGKTAYLIFNDKVRKHLGQIEGYFKLDLVKEGRNAKDLAKKIKIPADNLSKTLVRYDKAVKDKKDVDFGRSNMLFELNSGHLYAIEVAPGVHYTMGGVQIDTEARVLNKKGRPIKNFYAAGEVTGGVHGANRLGGNSISETVTFGRIAGYNAGKNAVK